MFVVESQSKHYGAAHGAVFEALERVPHIAAFSSIGC